MADEDVKNDELNTDDDVMTGEDNHEEQEFNVDLATPEEIAMEIVKAIESGNEDLARELITHQATIAVGEFISRDEED